MFTSGQWGYLAGVASALLLILGVKGYQAIAKAVGSVTHPYPGDGNGG